MRVRGRRLGARGGLVFPTCRHCARLPSEWAGVSVKFTTHIDYSCCRLDGSQELALLYDH